MGNWQLEIYKFAMYVFAPVTAFYIYHKVDFFNEDLEKFNRKVNTPQMLANEKQMKEDLELMRQLREAGIRKNVHSKLREAGIRKKLESQAQD